MNMPGIMQRYVDGYVLLHWPSLDIRRDSITVVNAVENNRRFQIEAMLTASWKTPSLVAPPRCANNNLACLLHLLSKSRTNKDSHTATYDSLAIALATRSAICIEPLFLTSTSIVIYQGSRSYHLGQCPWQWLHHNPR